MMITLIRYSFLGLFLLTPNSAIAALIANLAPQSSLTIPEGGTVAFSSSVTATTGHIGSGSVSYSPGGPATLLSGPGGYSLVHGATTTSSPGSTTWRYLDSGTFTHVMGGSGTEHNSFHQTISSSSFSSQSSARQTVSVGNVDPTLVDFQFLASPSAQYLEGQIVTMRFEATDPGFFDDIDFLINGQRAASHTTDTVDPRIVQQGVALTQQGFSTIVQLVVQARDKDGGLSNTIAGPTIQILNRDPIIHSLTSDLTVLPDTPFNFFAFASDPGNDPLTYRWDLDDDGQFDDFFSSGGQHAFSLEGIYPISIRVQDDGGGSVTRQFMVTVVPEPSALALFSLCAVGQLTPGRRRRR